MLLLRLILCSAFITLLSVGNGVDATSSLNFSKGVKCSSCGNNNALMQRLPLALTKLKKLSKSDETLIETEDLVWKPDISPNHFVNGARKAIQDKPRTFLKAVENIASAPPQRDTGVDKMSWKIWTLILVIGFLLLFLIVFLLHLKAVRRRKHNPNSSPQVISLDEKEVIISKPEKKPLEELVFFVEKEGRFKLEDLLESAADLRSQGFCSSLYVVQMKNDVFFAVKRLKMLKASFEEFGVRMRRIGNLCHPNILPLVCYNSTHEEKLLIYRFQTNGSLLNLFENYVEGKRKFPWKLRMSIAVGIARGLNFIHAKETNLPHGNIKLSNIMLNDEEQPMISEYGYSDFVHPKKTCLFLKGYTSPENVLSQQADVYSFGVILMELLTGKIVEKSGLDLPKWVRAIVREEWTGEVFDKEIADVEMYAFSLLNVSLKCVANDPEERPSMAEVVEKIEEVANAQGDVIISRV